MTRPPAPMLRLILEATRPDTVLVSVGGELDLATSDQLVEAAAEWIAEHHPEVVVLDLSDVTFLGAAGLRALLRVRDLATDTDADLRIVATSTEVLRPLRVTDLLDGFHVSGSIPTARPSDDDQGPAARPALEGR